MFKKCQTNCQADKNLWVRNNVFYFMVELPRKNGKRRYLCKSLHTKNYYEAQERLKIMKQSMRTNNIEVKSYINVAQSIINQLNFVEYEEEVEVAGQVLLQRKKYISEQNDPALIERLIAIVGKLSTFTQQTLDDDDIKIIKEIINISVAAQIQEVYKKGVVKSKTPPAGALTIEKVMIYMLNKVNNVQKVRIKREKRIEKMMSWVGLKLTDQYSKFYKADIIDKICEKIKKLDIKSGVKRTYTLDEQGNVPDLIHKGLHAHLRPPAGRNDRHALSRQAAQNIQGEIRDRQIIPQHRVIQVKGDGAEGQGGFYAFHPSTAACCAGIQAVKPAM